LQSAFHAHGLDDRDHAASCEHEAGPSAVASEPQPDSAPLIRGMAGGRGDEAPESCPPCAFKGAAGKPADLVPATSLGVAPESPLAKPASPRLAVRWTSAERGPPLV
jgi:hypothetical protein